jgi:hypothetical protein
VSLQEAASGTGSFLQPGRSPCAASMASRAVVGCAGRYADEPPGHSEVTMRLHNTLTRRVDDLALRIPGEVWMYMRSHGSRPATSDVLGERDGPGPAHRHRLLPRCAGRGRAVRREHSDPPGRGNRGSRARADCEPTGVSLLVTELSVVRWAAPGIMTGRGGPGDLRHRIVEGVASVVRFQPLRTQLARRWRVSGSAPGAPVAVRAVLPPVAAGAPGASPAPAPCRSTPGRSLRPWVAPRSRRRCLWHRHVGCRGQVAGPAMCPAPSPR